MWDQKPGLYFGCYNDAENCRLAIGSHSLVWNHRLADVARPLERLGTLVSSDSLTWRTRPPNWHLRSYVVRQTRTVRTVNLPRNPLEDIPIVAFARAAGTRDTTGLKEWRSDSHGASPGRPASRYCHH